ncbi:hypothetical protein EUTSA_v10015103mg [Eutrema salsugineum]|uniref:Uncharacterized protein n=1 Tax=Eutrema salsugineum TaxID=72664 RepID=V4LGX6_EUTSA|nr:hypothetical protein EUTSA_v10015103mg [Eutrema salsugineum]
MTGATTTHLLLRFVGCLNPLTGKRLYNFLHYLLIQLRVLRNVCVLTSRCPLIRHALQENSDFKTNQKNQRFDFLFFSPIVYLMFNAGPISSSINYIADSKS